MAKQRSLTLSVSSREAVKHRTLAALDGVAQGSHISFASTDLLWQTLTRKRWELIRVMTGAGAMSIREVARRSGRDVKAVHGDVHALIAVGIVQRTEKGTVVFPYDAVHVDFMLGKAA